MKILGISGSPRKRGNTDILLEEVLKGASVCGAETAKIVLNDLDISPCQEKEYTDINGEGFSVVDDDMKIVYDKVSDADVLVIASPVFFGSLSAQMKTMIDRFQCVWLAKHIFKKNIFPVRKIGGFICVSSAERQDFFDNARSIVRHFFAVINAEYKDELFCSGIDKKGGIRERPDLVEKAYKMGQTLAACP